MNQSITFPVAKPTTADMANATKTVATYRANGGGSNRTNWTQVTAVLCAVICAIRTGKSVEITEFYTGQIGTKSPAYNLAHRQLSAGVIRPLWASVQVLALVNAKVNGNGTATGTPNTTAPMSSAVRLYVSPTA